MPFIKKIDDQLPLKQISQELNNIRICHREWKSIYQIKNG
jgi:hypothetical protein